MNTKLSQINIGSLAALLTKKLGIGIDLEFEVREYCNGTEFIAIRSQELKDKAGIMAVTYKSLHIVNFGGHFTQEDDYYWMPIHFDFEYEKGGRNGTEILTAFYHFATGEWKTK